MASYPAAIAPDSALIVADDRKSSTLLGAISAGTTTIVVTSGVFSAYSVVTIENERILLGASVISGTYTGCTRGYDNSTAASHVNGVAVNANVVAAHHNVLRTEIQAVEGALGVNLRFVGKVFNADGFVFTFAGITNLTAATPATVIITPSPAGINSLSVNRHFLYITDGASSESVSLTGVTVGASSTTVNFTPANSHTSGQWTLGSATSGIQEAIHYAEAITGGGVVQIPSGVSVLKQRIFIGGVTNSVTLAGERLGCTLQQTTDNPILTAADAIQFWKLRGFTTKYSGVTPTASAISLINATSGTPVIDDLQVIGGLYGIAVATFDGLTVRNSSVTGCQLDGINTTAISNSSFQSVTSKSNNVAGGAGCGLFLSGICGYNSVNNCRFQNNAYGLYISGIHTVLNLNGIIATNNSTQDIRDVASSRTSWAVSNNIGATTVQGTVTAANTIALPNNLPSVVEITGTTTIKTINGFYGTGHTVVFICPSGLTFDATGNVAVATTTTYASQLVTAVYSSTYAKWYLSLAN